MSPVGRVEGDPLLNYKFKMASRSSAKPNDRKWVGAENGSGLVRVSGEKQVSVEISLCKENDSTLHVI